MKEKLAQSALRIVGWKVVKRASKSLPMVGTVVAVGLAGNEIRKKGVKLGLAEVALDALPVVGTVKNVIEFFTGDLIPDRK